MTDMRIEDALAEIARLASLADDMGQTNSMNQIEIEQLQAEIAKLKAITAHAAGFLDGMAARIEGWKDWGSKSANADFAQAAEDCRTMAASLQHILKP